MAEAGTNGRGWYRDSMPLIVAFVGGLFALASKIESCGAKRDAVVATREAVVATAVAGAALEVSDSLRVTAEERSDSLRVAFLRIDKLEGNLKKLDTPAVRRVIAATRGESRPVSETPRPWWKLWG